ncbi:MAG TPA: prolyl oligopeptidase family serine peptidase [Candidatus Acidoferrales bacterium]|nr:prolyl oligopeptidase family serine peptidase [Candidatus Acidoferrales bacterium]
MRRDFILACGALVCCGLFCVPGTRGADGPFTLEQVMSAPFPEHLVASPKGNRVAWVFDAQGRRNIWVAEGPQFTPRQLTSYTDDDGQELSDVAFSTDGNFIVYVRGGDKNHAGENPNPTSNSAGAEQAVWIVNWAGGAPHRIDAGSSPEISPRGDWIAYVRDGQIWLAAVEGSGKPEHLVTRGQDSLLAWSPDGRLLAFASGRGDHSFIGILDVAQKTIRYLAPSVDSDTLPKWSPDGKQIAFIRRPANPRDAPIGFFIAPDHPQPWAIWAADAATGAARRVWQSTTGMEGSFPSQAGRNAIQWAANGTIVFASEEDGWEHLYSLSSAGGSPALLTPGACEYEHMTLTPDRRSIIYSSNCGDIDRRHLWRVSASGGAPEQLTGGDGLEWSPAVTGDGATIVYLASDARWPAMPYTRPAQGKAIGKPMTAGLIPSDFPASKLVVPKQILIPSTDGLTIHGQLFMPALPQPGTKFPAVIFMHGGPIRQMLLGWHYLYYYSNAYAMNQYLASRGYIVLSVNYRSGIGYGRAFRMAKGRAGRGASDYQDIVAAGNYLRNLSEVDAAHIGLWGGSYGGFLTAMGLARNSDLFAGGVDLHGVHDWSKDDIRQQKNLTSEVLQLAHDSSPVSAVKTWRSPVLLIQGDDDRNVDFTQTVDLAARLRQQNVEVEQLIFPDEIHDFLMHRSWLAAYHAAADFFDRHFKAK